jgi:hypothetical protein
MFKLLGIVAIISTCIQGIKEATSKTLTAEDWANKELQNRDRMNGMSEKEIIKNAERGRYHIPKSVFEAYPVPHREKSGQNRIIIENCELHKKDVAQYGAYEAQKWVKQGKYNLTEKELEITHLQYEKDHLNLCVLSSRYNRDKEKARIKEIDEILATKNWDCRKAEAVLQWQKAHDAEMQFYK